MLLFFFDLSSELCVALDPVRMSFEYAAGVAPHGTYHISKKAAAFGALEA
jgi:hypothetical protein